MRARRPWPLRAILMLMLVLALATTSFAVLAEDPTELPGTKMIECPDCGVTGGCSVCLGTDPACEACGGTFVCPTCGGDGYIQSPSRFYNTIWSLLPPVIAIALALITKESCKQKSIAEIKKSRKKCATEKGHDKTSWRKSFASRDKASI